MRHAILQPDAVHDRPSRYIMTTQQHPSRPPRIPAELVEKYSGPGPRYTSYPTAPHFTEAFGPDAYLAEVGRFAPAGREVSIYVHLPFCRSLCHYCACHMMVTHRPDKIARYVDYLKREIDAASRRVGAGRKVVQIHWGGGTPTYMEPEGIQDLMAHITSRFDLADDAEISIEADPRGLTEAHLEAARRAGFNRISFGVQDFDPKVQAAINRIQPESMVAAATRRARALGFEGMNYDLIYGLPYQTCESFVQTLRSTIAHAPDRISVFGYAHVPWKKKHQRLIEQEHLPPPRERLDLLMTATEMLTGEGGYRYIGMDHFARPDDPLALAQEARTMHRNFQGYSTRAGGDLFAFGISGISQIGDAYAQNVLDLRSYYDAVEAGRPPVYRGYRMTRDDRIRRDVIMRLMCDFELYLPDVSERHGIAFFDYFSDAAEALATFDEEGLVGRTSSRITVTELGRYFVRNVAMAFDAYLRDASKAHRPLYSQAV